MTSTPKFSIDEHDAVLKIHVSGGEAEQLPGMSMGHVDMSVLLAAFPDMRRGRIPAEGVFPYTRLPADGGVAVAINFWQS